VLYLDCCVLLSDTAGVKRKRQPTFADGLALPAAGGGPVGLAAAAAEPLPDPGVLSLLPVCGAGRPEPQDIRHGEV